ncbi:MAG: hypothetical protein OXR68_03685 [Alphaproteobacteria bacterium]|nr:hypothetical protein [Alphaproteobacteria bacterium]MDD9919708.1 hypothetical protein [Alphaproteobacteria bacterium]
MFDNGNDSGGNNSANWLSETQTKLGLRALGVEQPVIRPVLGGATHQVGADKLNIQPVNEMNVGVFGATKKQF